MGLWARFSRLVKGFVGLFVSGVEERNPEALMEAARQDFRDRSAQYNQALARMAGIAERLKVQIRTKTAKTSDLERRILANFRAGNAELAGSLARELQELKADLARDADELKETDEAYQLNFRQLKIVQKEFEERIRQLEKQLSEVKIKEAQAEAAAALGGVSFQIGDAGDTMKTVEEVLNKRYEMAAGKARVARDSIDSGRIAEKEKEQKALEQVALADFLASQGIQAPPAVETPPASKQIGPAQAEPPAQAQGQSQ